MNVPPAAGRDGSTPAPSPGVPVLSVKGLTVGLAGRSILSDVSFDVEPASTIGVIGASGSGKTVLARACVAWLDAPLAVRRGGVEYGGRDILALKGGALRALRREIAFVGANPMGALDPTIPVGPQIVEKLRAVLPGVSRAEAKRRALDLLDAVRIPSAASRFHDHASLLSGGMMQRVLIVDALVSNPKLLVADNITQPLDVTVGAQVLRLLRELTDRYRTAIVFVSSSLPTVCEAAERVLVLDGGCVVEDRRRQALIERPEHAYTADLIARTPRIWLRGAEVPRRRPTGSPILGVRGATRSYRAGRGGGLRAARVRAVRGVTFDIHAGETFGIVGESGCGKSSLTRLLSRLEPPDEGRVLFEGVDLARLSRRDLLAFRRKVQLVLQDPFDSLPPRTAIGAIIGAPLRVHGLGDARSRRERVLAAMREVGLSPALHDELPVGLSAGQRQRVSIARAMVLEPKVLILDETLSALDQAEQFKLLDLFGRLREAHDLTYVFVSHDLALVRRACDRIAVMYLGEVVELVGNERLFFDPGHPYSRALLSAIPTLEERRYRSQDCLLDGEPPNPINLPAGCGFANRCPTAFPRCRDERPALHARGGGDAAACFLIDPPATAPARPGAAGAVGTDA